MKTIKSKIILMMLIFLPGISVLAQNQGLNQTMFDTIAKEQILIGYCNRAGLEGDIFGQYFNDEYKNYTPDPQVIDLIKNEIKGIGITIVMATWCSDSREQVGRFYKILDLVGYPSEKVTLVCVDKKKKGGPVSLEGMDIQKVPTFIILLNGQEKGRIIESPSETLEKDLLKYVVK